MQEFVLDLFKDHGLWALFVLMVADNVGVPFPSEVPLLFAGFLVSGGDMAYAPAVLVAATGSLAGALILYALGRSVGRAAVLRWGRFIRFSEQDLIRAERWFHRRGEVSVFALRVVPLARTIISIPAGALEMKAIRFSAYTFAGSALWTVFVVGVGWGLGENYERVLDQFGLASIAGASLVAMVIAIWLARRFLSRREAAEGRPRDEEPPAPPGPGGAAPSAEPRRR